MESQPQNPENFHPYKGEQYIRFMDGDLNKIPRHLGQDHFWPQG